MKLFGNCNPWRLAILSAAALMPLFLFSGCSGAAKTPSSGWPPPGAPKKKDRRFLVRVEKVATRPIRYEIETTGTVEAKDVHTLHAKVQGAIQDVNFNEGDEVTPQTVLARVAPYSHQIAVEQTEAAHKKSQAELIDMERRSRNDVEMAKVRLKEADVEVARRLPLRAIGAISQEEVELFQAKRDVTAIELKTKEEESKTLVEVHRASVREKEMLWKLAEDNQRKSIVVPPIAGVIEQRLVSSGAVVTQGTPLAVLVDRASMRLRFTLPESKASHVESGSQVTFRVEAYPARTFKATVYRIGDLADEKTRQVNCWARVEPTDAHLKGGFFATVTLVTDAKAQATVVPVTATLPTERGFVAYVIQDGKAVQRSLKLGLHVTGDLVEVITGLAEGERVVVEGANALQDGVEVTDLEKPDKSGGDGGAKSADDRTKGARNERNQ